MFEITEVGMTKIKNNPIIIYMSIFILCLDNIKNKYLYPNSNAVKAIKNNNN